MEQFWDSLTKYYGTDWVGIIFSMVSTHFLAKKRKRGFLIGMIGNLAFIAFGFLAQSAANVVAGLAYFTLNTKGWFNWKKSPPQSNANCDCSTEEQGAPILTSEPQRAR